MWIEQGDKNTKKNHKQATTHKIYNCIDKLIIDGELVEDDEIIKVHILDFYKNLFSESEQWRPSWENDSVKRLSNEDKEWLERSFTMEELEKVIISVSL